MIPDFEFKYMCLKIHEEIENNKYLWCILFEAMVVVFPIVPSNFWDRLMLVSFYVVLYNIKCHNHYYIMKDKYLKYPKNNVIADMLKKEYNVCVDDSYLNATVGSENVGSDEVGEGIESDEVVAGSGAEAVEVVAGSGSGAESDEVVAGSGAESDQVVAEAGADSDEVVAGSGAEAVEVVAGSGADSDEVVSGSGADSDEVVSGSGAEAVEVVAGSGSGSGAESDEVGSESDE